MHSPFSNGTIRQQDIQDRNIARQRISEAIAKEQRRIDILVDTVVNAVEKHGMNMTTVERLWQDIQLDSQLKDIRLIADSNASDYPGFFPWLNGQRLNIETSGRMRLASELNDRLSGTLRQYYWLSACLRLTLQGLSVHLGKTQ